jgi:hypothetical protein
MVVASYIGLYLAAFGYISHSSTFGISQIRRWSTGMDPPNGTLHSFIACPYCRILVDPVELSIASTTLDCRLGRSWTIIVGGNGQLSFLPVIGHINLLSFLSSWNATSRERMCSICCWISNYVPFSPTQQVQNLLYPSPARTNSTRPRPIKNNYLQGPTYRYGTSTVSIATWEYAPPADGPRLEVIAVGYN